MEKERPVETDKSLPLGFKVMIVVNIIAVLGIGAFAHRAGGFVSGVFPSDHRIDNRSAKPREPAAPAISGTAQRTEPSIPPEYRSVEPLAPRWEVLPNGSIRFAN